jgi:hypothetical protein
MPAVPVLVSGPDGLRWCGRRLRLGPVSGAAGPAGRPMQGRADATVRVVLKEAWIAGRHRSGARRPGETDRCRVSQDTRSPGCAPTRGRCATKSGRGVQRMLAGMARGECTRCAGRCRLGISLALSVHSVCHETIAANEIDVESLPNRSELQRKRETEICLSRLRRRACAYTRVTVVFSVQTTGSVASPSSPRRCRTILYCLKYDPGGVTQPDVFQVQSLRISVVRSSVAER